MPDDFFTRSAMNSPPARKPAGIGRLIGVVAALSFLVGGGLVGWLAYRGTVNFSDPWQAVSTVSPAARPATSRPIAALPAVRPGPAQSPASAGSVPVGSAPNSINTASAVDQRLAQLEQRLNALDLRTQTATGNAARAEGLLIALAARRAVERGMPLGNLEDQLRTRFGNAQPNAVRILIEGARQPVTIDKLDAGLTAFAAQIAAGQAELSGWDRFSRQMSGLFVIRRTQSPAAGPEQRLDQAKLLLRSGQSEAAANLIAPIPGSAEMRGWIAEARRLAAMQQALEQIEAAAILEPRELADGRGQQIEQVSPVAEPMF